MENEDEEVPMDDRTPLQPVNLSKHIYSPLVSSPNITLNLGMDPETFQKKQTEHSKKL